MRRFAQLYAELDATSRTADKVAALQRYFREAPPADAAWALFFLTGQRLLRSVASPRLREWIAEFTGYPLWLIQECYDVVGDQSETLTLLLPENPAPVDVPLHTLVEERLVPLRALSDDGRRSILRQTWSELSRPQCYLFHKLISGTFRVGVARGLVLRAIAEIAGVDPAVMQHRLLRRWRPTPADYQRLLDPPTTERDPAQPYPFFLASPLEGQADDLGPLTAWQIEWKWDGIRAQMIHRGDERLLWSRGEELITARFPELLHIISHLPDGVVLDGEILAWEDERPLPFTRLQRRITRKHEQPRFWPETPVVFLVYDLLEADGADIRSTPLAERRARLEALVADMPRELPLRISPLEHVPDWAAARALLESARARGVEGFMLKKLTSPYGVGRTRGDWWKWKCEPFCIDAVLVFAQRGSGRRAGLYTDYTFAVWSNSELLPVAKAYSGLSDEEIRAVDRFIRDNTLGRRGPLRIVKPELVFELGFEALQDSTRHRAGIALRFPRILRQRLDKRAIDADTLEAVRKLMAGGCSE